MRELVLAATMVVMVAHLQGAAVGEGGAGEEGMGGPREEVANKET